MSEIQSQLTGLILPRGEAPAIGKETGKNVHDGISLFFQSMRTFMPNSPFPRGGSYRFVRFVGGEIVAGLQVMSRTGESGFVANVYCHPDWRRRGYATELLEEARRTFFEIEFSEDRSSDGQAWVNYNKPEIRVSETASHGPKPR